MSNRPKSFLSHPWSNAFLNQKKIDSVEAVTKDPDINKKTKFSWFKKLFK
jgi:hypothetical protein